MIKETKAKIQMEKLIAQAALNKRRRVDCPIGGIGCQCHGWLNTVDAQGIAAQYQARLKGIRDELGWRPVKAEKPVGEFGDGIHYYHFMHKEAVQKGLPLPKREVRIGMVPLSRSILGDYGLDLVPMELFQLKKA